MDSILPSAGTYKLNIKINDSVLDDLSFITSNDTIRPFFEESVSDDQDITALLVFLRNSAGDIVGDKILYSLEQDDSLAEKDENEIIIPVKSLDNDLPVLPLPENLPIGVYTITSQVMSARNILQRTERTLFYLGEMDFSFEGIDVYLPGTPESPQLIPKGTNVMLKARLDFDSYFDPYIVWYNGRRKIEEGHISEGAGQFFWKVPEQTGFFSLRAEVFPVRTNEKLSGYQKEISLLVSSKAMDTHFISNHNQREFSQLLQWYNFDGNLNDLQIISSTANAKWMGIDGTYGLVTGRDNSIKLPLLSLPNDEVKTWQAMLRFLPLNDGTVFSVLFDPLQNVTMTLSIEDQNLILTLSSLTETVSKTYSLTANMPFAELLSDELSAYSQTAKYNSFITIGVNFSIMKGQLTAQLMQRAQLKQSAQFNNIGGHFISEFDMNPITIETEIKNEFQIILGFVPGISAGSFAGSSGYLREERPEFVILWDEFALYYLPDYLPVTEIRTNDSELLAGKNQPEYFSN